MNENLREAVEDEWYLVRYSGENPEIAFQASVYYLTRDEQGPVVVLSGEELAALQDAAVARFTEIIVRDMFHENYGTSAYRGISRSIVNYNRFKNFCERQRRKWPEVRQTAATTLRSFMEAECVLLKNPDRETIIDCSLRELQDFITELGVQVNCKLDEFVSNSSSAGGT